MGVTNIHFLIDKNLNKYGQQNSNFLKTTEVDGNSGTGLTQEQNVAYDMETINNYFIFQYSIGVIGK